MRQLGDKRQIARLRATALLQVQEGLSKLRAVDEVAAIVDRAPRDLVECCGFAKLKRQEG